MATQYSERSAFADEDDDGLLEVLSKNGIDIQGDELAQNPVQLGENAAAVTGATSLGVDSIADSNSSVSVGRDAQATGNDTTAVGAETRAPANWNSVFGYQMQPMQRVLEQVLPLTLMVQQQSEVVQPQAVLIHLHLEKTQLSPEMQPLDSGIEILTCNLGGQ